MFNTRNNVQIKNRTLEVWTGPALFYRAAEAENSAQNLSG